MTSARTVRLKDAVHLASALAIGDPDLIVAVWDRRLPTGGQAVGCSVGPAHLDEKP
jgi:uncharacterized protein